MSVTEGKMTKPRMYCVLLVNDDDTPAEFVAKIIMHVFHKTEDEAHALVAEIHNDGQAVCGTYTHEIAETKAMAISVISGHAGHPLMATLRPAKP